MPTRISRFASKGRLLCDRDGFGLLDHTRDLDRVTTKVLAGLLAETYLEQSFPSSWQFFSRRYLLVFALAFVAFDTTICASILYPNRNREGPANPDDTCMQPPLCYERRCLSASSLPLGPRSGDRGISAAWQEAISQGEERLRMLAAPTNQVEQSPFVHPGDLARYGWRLDAELDADVRRKSSLRDWQDAWTELRLPEQTGSTVKVEWGQKIPSAAIDGKIYQPSGGRFSNIYNSEIILGSVAYSPTYKAPRHDPPVQNEDITPLRKWSDVAFLEQMRQCGQDSQRLEQLRFLGAMSVVTGSTRAILIEAIGGEARLAEMPKGWDFRKTWTTTSAEGKAVLGTVHGAWPAYLLAQHKRQLGRKSVTAVSVFLGSDRKFNLLFEIQAVDDQ